MIDYYKIMQDKLKAEDKDLLLNIQKKYNKEITRKASSYSFEKATKSIEEISKEFEFTKKGKVYTKKISYKDFALEIEIKKITLKSSFIFTIDLDKHLCNKIIISQENYFEEPKKIKEFEVHLFTNKGDTYDLEETHTYIQHMISPYSIDKEMYGYNYDEKHKELKDSSFFNIEIINFFLENYNKIDEAFDLITLEQDITIQKDLLMNNFIDTFKAFQQTHLKNLNKRQRSEIKNNF